jgi:hypothetical protein
MPGHCVVDHDVDAARELHQIFDLRRLSQVGAVETHLDAMPARKRVPRALLLIRRREAVEDHAAAFGRETVGDRKAQAGG